MENWEVKKCGRNTRMEVRRDLTKSITLYTLTLSSEVWKQNETEQYMSRNDLFDSSFKTDW